MSRLDDLKARQAKAEERLQKLQDDREVALQKVRDRFNDRCRKAIAEAAAAQKAVCDAEAAEALRGRDDAEAIAQALGLELPEED